MSGFGPWIFLAFLLVGFALAWGWWRLKRRNAELNRSLVRLNQEVNRQEDRNRHMSRELQGSEEQLQRRIDEVGAALWQYDLKTNFFFASQLILLATGFTRDQVNGHPRFVIDHIHPDDRPQVKTSYLELQAGACGEALLEIRLLFGDGTYHWAYTRAIVNHDRNGKIDRLVGSFSDITARITAEEERDRLFNLSIDMLAVWGFDGVLQQVNPAWVRVLGWSRDELMGQHLLYFVHPQDQEATDEAFQSLFRGQPQEALDMRFRCRDGNYLWLSWSSFPYSDRQAVFSVVKDITRNKQAEKRLLDYQERLRSLSTQLSLVEDRQRKALADAIHDGVAQQLFGIRAKVTLFKYPDKITDPVALATETLEIIDETMSQTRNLSFELFPPVLHEVGLDAALNWLGHQFTQRTGIHCEVEIHGQGPDLSEDLRTMAFQSVRELLANIRKHSGAESCRISADHLPGYLTLLVEDPGRGFSGLTTMGQTEISDAHAGFGLFSIRERMRSVGGRMLVDSQPNQGCRVFLTFPNTSNSNQPEH